MFNIGKTKKTVSFLLVALFVSYYAGLTLFSHTHVISGATIVHSHIHANSHHDTKSGGHSEQEITLIAQISQFEYANFVCCDIPAPSQTPLHENKYIETTCRTTPVHLLNISLRAPPVV